MWTRCTLIVKKMLSKYSQWRSFSESKSVPCTNSFSKKNDCPYWLVVWPICLNFIEKQLLTIWHKCPSKASLLRCMRVLEENTTWNVDRLHSYVSPSTIRSSARPTSWIVPSHRLRLKPSANPRQVTTHTTALFMNPFFTYGALNRVWLYSFPTDTTGPLSRV